MIPVPCIWNGEAFVPLRQFAVRCAEQFKIGERYRMVEFDDASSASRNHYFAALHEAWLNLPHDVAGEFMNEDHFRKWCLIRTGYFDERKIVCVSPAEALRVATDFTGDYDMVLVEGRVVVIRTAKTQKSRVMGAKDFQVSKTAVLDYAASLIGVTVDTLAKNAGRAA